MKINLDTSHPSAFISSTFLDLTHERKAAAKALGDAHIIVNALDVKPASNNSSRVEIINGIRESDFIVLIVGERYGSIIPKMTGRKDFSITQWEYHEARKQYHKHILVYFMQREITDSKYSDDPRSGDFELKRRSLKKFKDELSSAHNPKYFTTPEELAEEVTRAIIPMYRNSVKALVRNNETLKKEVTSLQEENQQLKATAKLVRETEVSPRDHTPLRSFGLDLVNKPPDAGNHGYGLKVFKPKT